jgi:cyclophilin family peptidyl-prolyl cis-trans isomerase
VKSEGLTLSAGMSLPRHQALLYWLCAFVRRVFQVRGFQMPKKQPKRNKRKGRTRRTVDWSGPETKHGPFGLFSNVKFFYLIGIIIMVGSLALGSSLCRPKASTPQPTPTAASETPTPSPDQVTPTATVQQVQQWPAAPGMSIDTAKTYTATITTTKGAIQVDLFAADAPNAVNNFVFLAQQGFFKDLPFYYADASTVDTGDPSINATSMTQGGPGYEIPTDTNKRTFDAGSLGMFSGKQNGMSAGSRFFIVIDPSKSSFSNLWPFGQVKSGMDVVKSLTTSDTILSVDIQVQ